MHRWKRLAAFVLVLSLFGSSCSSGSGNPVVVGAPTGTETASPPDKGKSEPAPVDIEDESQPDSDESLPDEGAEPVAGHGDGLQSYEWRQTFYFADDSPLEVIEMWGSYDPTKNIGTADIALADVLASYEITPTLEVELDALIESIYKDGTSIARGLVPELGLAKSVDPLLWYETDFLLSGKPDVLFDVQSFDALRELIEVSASTTDTTPTAGNVNAFEVRIDDPDDLDRLEDTILGGLRPGNLPAELVIERNSAGKISRVGIEVNPDADGDYPTRWTIQTFNFGVAIKDLPPIDDIHQLPDELEHTRAVGTEQPADLTIASLANPGSEVVFKFNTYLGFLNDSLDAPPEFSVSLTPEGKFIRVNGTSVYDGADSYEQWQLTPQGIERLIAELDASSMVGFSGGDRQGSNDVAYALTVSGFSLLNAHPDAGSATPAEQAELHRIAELLFDPSWLGDDISEAAPWVPDALTFRVQLTEDLTTGPRGGVNGEPYDWPIDTPIGEHPGLFFSGEAQMICLTGEEAATAWTLIREGENHAYIQVESGGAIWTLSYRIVYPGYRPADAAACTTAA